jgi:flagellar hook-basal body complex protein FliE
MEINTKVDQLLGQMRTAQSLASKLASRVGSDDATGSVGGTNKADFSAALKSAIDQVNRAQSQAESMTKSFEIGTPGVQLHDVMISMSKASVSFQQMVQVRNKLVSAYHDIMNMQV